MRRIIYISHEAVPFDAQDLKRLLTRSRFRNADACLTGLLIYSDGWFLQALEGDEGPLTTTFARIDRDPRHADLRILHSEEVSERAFGKWSMGYADSHAALQVRRGHIDVRDKLNLSSLDGAQAFEVLLQAAQLVPA